jgi:integrase
VTPPSSALTGALQFGGTPNGLREAHDRLTLEAAASIMSEAMRDKSYQATKLGEEVARYLRWMQTADYADRTYYEYESVLYRFVLDHADLALGLRAAGRRRADRGVDRRRTGATRAPARSGRCCRPSARSSSGATAPADLERPDAVGAAAEEPPHDPAGALAASGHDIVRAQPLLRDQCCVMLLGKLGLRKNELRLLQIKDIDLDQEQIRLNQKGGDVVFHPIVFPDVLQRLAEHFTLDGSGAERVPALPALGADAQGRTKVFQREDRDAAMSMRGVHEWWVRVLERAEVPHFPMHEMRHTAGTEFHRAGRRPRADAAVHAPPLDQTTSEVYMHLDREDLTNAMLKVRWSLGRGEVRGPDQICTGVRGFAGRCLTTRPPGLMNCGRPTRSRTRMVEQYGRLVYLVPLLQADLTAVQDLVDSGRAQASGFRDRADGGTFAGRLADCVVSSLGRRSRLGGGSGNCGERFHLRDRVGRRERQTTEAVFVAGAAIALDPD